MRRGAVSIGTHIAPDVPPLLADPHQLRQLFSNLLANAFEALGGEGHVDIRGTLLPGEDEPAGATEPTPPQVVVEVRDTGPGIAPDDLERIFSPFFTTKPQGTGLGLAIVDHTMRGHGGFVRVESAPERGSTFTLFFPVPARAVIDGAPHEAHPGDRGRTADAARSA
jgi:signal transduction histidine kinase